MFHIAELRSRHYSKYDVYRYWNHVFDDEPGSLGSYYQGIGYYHVKAKLRRTLFQIQKYIMKA